MRAFDVRSGALRWSWDPIPWASHTTPRTGAGNAWSTLSVDAERGLVFVPTGSPSPDHYGGVRKGDNRWANSVVALRAATGDSPVWGFQVAPSWGTTCWPSPCPDGDLPKRTSSAEKLRGEQAAGEGSFVGGTMADATA